ncbi:MAG: class A beta-lactamase-related serine hydrolase [Candidatus Sumerlaeaceae bacterium]|nr:class A beta-lactamase-related serine hydrolase [Candidatus Sumerlaeaceae bacterium]
MRKLCLAVGLVGIANLIFAQETLVPQNAWPVRSCESAWAYRPLVHLCPPGDKKAAIPIEESRRVLCEVMGSPLLSKAVEEWVDLGLGACHGLNKEDVAVSYLLISRENHGAPHLGHFRGEESAYPSSVAKLFYAVAAYKKMQDRCLRDSKIEADITAMLRDDDHEAANRVVDFISGTESGEELSGGDFKAFARKRHWANRYFEKLGFEGINVSQKFWTDTPSPRDLQLLGEKLPRNYVNSNQISANQAAQLLYLVYADAIVSKEACEKIKKAIERRVDQAKLGALQGIAAGLPSGSKMWSVKGFTYQDFNEVALVALPNGQVYVLSVFTRYPDHVKNFSTQVSRIVANRAMIHTADDDYNNAYLLSPRAGGE